MGYRRGDLVKTWFDTGALGPQILYGRVVAAGPRTFTVEWESTLRNRFAQDEAGGLTRVTAEDIANEAIDDRPRGRRIFEELGGLRKPLA